MSDERNNHMEEQPTHALATVSPGMGYAEQLRIAKILAESTYFPNVRSAAQAYAKIQAGKELGIPPFAAMQGIDVISGKTVLSATLIATLIQNSKRFRYRVRERTHEACAIEFFEGDESLGIERFTLEDARRAVLLGKDNWRNYPKSMLFARAMRQGAITYCPAVFAGGAVYTPDELGPEINPDSGEILDGHAVEVVDASPPATAKQKSDIIRILGKSQEAMRWLAEHDLPVIGAMTQSDYERAMALLTPKPESEAPSAPEPAIVGELVS